MRYQLTQSSTDNPDNSQLTVLVTVMMAPEKTMSLHNNLKCLNYSKFSYWIVVFYLPMWIKRGLQSAKSDASQLCPTNDFLYRQKIVDTMAESMDTSEILADEDDRKLFVGGLPQVWTLVDISRVLQNLLSNCKLSFVTSVRAGRLMFTLFRTPSRRIYRYIFRLLERSII